MVAPRPTRPANPYAGPRAGLRPGSRPVSAAEIYRRPTVVTILAILNGIGGFLMVFGAIVFAAILPKDGSIGSPVVIQAVAAVYVAFGILSIVCAVGLWTLKGYGRVLQIVFAVIGLLGFPLGTLISVLILVYFFKPGAKVLFSDTPVGRLSATDVEEVRKLQESSGALAAVVAIVVILAGIAFIGIIAAIAIPSLLRARVSANEAAAIGDIRTILSAEAAYSTSNGGLFDSLECLLSPQGCLPSYPAGMPSFLDEPQQAVKSGYNREFVPGSPIDPSDATRRNVSPSSVSSFAYLAYPVSVGTTGVRSFCGDSTGRICAYVDGSRPRIENGICEMECPELR